MVGTFFGGFTADLLNTSSIGNFPPPHQIRENQDSRRPARAAARAVVLLQPRERHPRGRLPPQHPQSREGPVPLRRGAEVCRPLAQSSTERSLGLNCYSIGLFEKPYFSNWEQFFRFTAMLLTLFFSNAFSIYLSPTSIIFEGHNCGLKLFDIFGLKTIFERCYFVSLFKFCRLNVAVLISRFFL